MEQIEIVAHMAARIFAAGGPEMVPEAAARKGWELFAEVHALQLDGNDWVNARYSEQLERRNAAAQGDF